MAPFQINNRDARWLWLTAQGLATPPTGALDVMAIIRQLGFVQLDTIRVVARAHDHIIWSRNHNYREVMLNNYLQKHRTIFEHFTHDASVIPMEYLPYWQRQFRRHKERIESRNYFVNMLDADDRNAIKTRIKNEGPLSTHAFDTKVKDRSVMWSRPPHKQALDYMWYCGELATSHRENFSKFYDLAENIFPTELHETNHPDDHQLDWLLRNALDRLGFASLGEIQRFWDASSAVETRAWAAGSDCHTSVKIQTSDGQWVDAIAPVDIEQRVNALSKPTSRLRILNPFDPVVRDRDRLKRLFGLDYRIEIFVPAAKRKWGYYVYPILESDRFIGRIEMKADRKEGCINVINFWPDSAVKWTDARWQKLHSELARMARFIGVDHVHWHVDHK
ncbi:hypothetical protein BFP76_10575 [Amylibacter kogurei]|uniref:Winged helix-turn-helix domain-containing protein n=1 Tax=Paramylibacter kogurei TaxID=1889778 RepID=A0A2G5KCT7_9RHOB|nr:crosslink repair DNA glycosylase YcaQ family protein [Amylibacter kogurei]PIB26833.1 hypothetical protein BFP76_10575 [Amylibacter kogurei]